MRVVTGRSSCTAGRPACAPASPTAQNAAGACRVRRPHRHRLARQRPNGTHALNDGDWIVLVAVQDAIDDQPPRATPALRHDNGLRVDDFLSPSAAEEVAKDLTKAARAASTGTTGNFAPAGQRDSSSPYPDGRDHDVRDGRPHDARGRRAHEQRSGRQEPRHLLRVRRHAAPRGGRRARAGDGRNPATSRCPADMRS